MEQQLPLLDSASESPYRLDERTKASGRRGIARARAALQAAAAAGRAHDVELSLDKVDMAPFGPPSTRRRAATGRGHGSAATDRPADAA